MTNLKHFLLSQPFLLSLYSFMFCIFFEGCNCDFSIWTEYINHCNNHTSLLVTSIMWWGPEPGPSPGQCSLRKQLTLLFATPPLFSQQNDVWETTTEIPYSDVVTTGQYFWLIEANFPCATTNKIHQPDLASDRSSEWNFCSPSMMSFRGETSGGDMKFWLLSQSETTWTITLKRRCYLKVRQDRNLNKQ